MVTLEVELTEKIIVNLLCSMEDNEIVRVIKNTLKQVCLVDSELDNLSEFIDTL